MIIALTEQKNSMTHMYEEYQSSCDSILFVQGLLATFQKDLMDTSKIRAAEVATMLTPQGKQLRRIILNMHDNLARQIQSANNAYTQIGKCLAKRTSSINQAIKEAQHCLDGWRQTNNFINIKKYKLQQEIDRIAFTNKQLTKDQNTYQNLNKMYKLDRSNLFQDPSQEEAIAKTKLKRKIQLYQTNKNNIKILMDEIEGLESIKLQQLLQQLKKLEKQMGQFDFVFEIQRDSYYKYHNISNEQTKIKKASGVFRNLVQIIEASSHNSSWSSNKPSRDQDNSMKNSIHSLKQSYQQDSPIL